MAYNEELAARIRQAMKPLSKHMEEKKMFGGLSFMYQGKMSVGVLKDLLTARVIEANHPGIMKEPGVKPMDFTGKPMKDFVYVEMTALKTEEDLMKWVNRGIEHATTK